MRLELLNEGAGDCLWTVQMVDETGSRRDVVYLVPLDGDGLEVEPGDLDRISSWAVGHWEPVTGEAMRVANAVPFPQGMPF